MSKLVEIKSVWPLLVGLTVMGSLVLMPIYSRGLRVEVDCDYISVGMDKVGSVVKEDGRCFVYTIPQLLNRDNVIRNLELFRGS